MRQQLSSITRFMLLPALIGLLAGVAGGLAGFSYYLSGLVDTSTGMPGLAAFTSSAPLPETELASRLSQMDFALYTKKTLPTGELADLALSPDKAAGSAAVLTSDGWLLTSQAALKAGPVEVAVGTRLVEPKQQVVDARTGAVFLKIDGGPFQVSDLEETDKLRPGTALYLLDGAGGFAKTWFTGAVVSAKPNRPAALRSSEAFDRAWRLEGSFLPGATGGAVLTAGGTLAGILAPADAGGASFVPIHLLRAVLSDAFRGQAIIRPTLGVKYVDLGASAFAGPMPDHAGLLLAGSRRDAIPAVVPNSPAAGAGLREGDILLGLDDVDFLSGRDLAETLAEYDPGTKVSLTVLRAGTKSTVEVVLK